MAPGQRSDTPNGIAGVWKRLVSVGMRRSDLLIVILLACVAATLVFWQLGEGSLGDYDEADYAQSAREMLWWSDFNTPRWNGMEFFDKPPLVYWLTALVYKVLGVNEFGARFVSAGSGVLAILLAYTLGRDLFQSRTIGLGASITLLTVSRNLFSHGYNFLGLARVGMLDMPLILTMMVAVWLAWHATASMDAVRDRYLVCLGVPLGLGLMIKSVAGLLAYGVVALYFLLGVPAAVWWRRTTLKGLLLSLSIAAPWHAGQILIWGRHFWDSYVVSLTLGYVTGEQGHTKDYLFYLRSIQRGFPVLYPVVAAAVLYALCRAAKRFLRRPTHAVEDRALVLLLCWTAVPFVLYNISRSRIGWYMISIYPALALLTTFLLYTLLRGLLSHVSGPVATKWTGRLVILFVLVATLVSGSGLPRVNDFNPDVKRVVSYGNLVLEEDAVLVNYWPGSYWIRPSALFYADRPLLLVTSEEALRRLLKTQGQHYVLADWAHWEPVLELGDVSYRSGQYVLVEAQQSARSEES